MKTVTVTIGERVGAVGLLNAGKFSNSTLAVVLDDIKKLAMTPEEWTVANLTKTPSDEEIAAMPKEERTGAVQAWKWDENDTTQKDVELDQGTVDALLGMISEKSDGKELTIQDAPLLSLQKKLQA